MKIVAGLGNPESKYDGTYHNTGFLAADLLAEALGVRFKKLACRAWCAEKLKKEGGFVIAKPQTYMNLSGESVKGLAEKFKAQPADIMIVYDDLDLDVGAVRIRAGGSSGTHNGMRNIVKCLGREDFPRIRVGIGRPAYGDVADYVLSHVPKAVQEEYLAGVKRAAEAAEAWLSGEALDRVMNRYNGKP